MSKEAQKVKEEIENCNDLEEKYERFLKYIKAAIFKATNKRKEYVIIIIKELNRIDEKEDKMTKLNNIFTNNKKRKRPAKSWWDKERKKIVENRKKWLNLFKRIKDIHSFIEFKKARAIAKKIINKKKKENFINYCSNINKFSNLNTYGILCVYSKNQEYLLNGTNGNWGIEEKS